MNFLSEMYLNINNFANLLKTPISNSKKIEITFNLLKINFKFKKNVKKTNFLKYNIYGFDFKTTQNLYKEIFVKNTYYCKLKKEPRIIDCGANIGFASLYFKYNYPKSKIIAFEPDHTCAKLLRKNIRKNNLKDITIIESAVSSKNGTIDFYSDLEEKPGLMMSTSKQRNERTKVKKIKSVDLSKFIKTNFINEKLDLLKIDIEGEEFEVFKKLSEDNTFKLIDNIMIEYHHKIGKINSRLGQFLEFLEIAGYEYQISSLIMPLGSKNKCQDIMIYAYKNI